FDINLLFGRESPDLRVRQRRHLRDHPRRISFRIYLVSFFLRHLRCAPTLLLRRSLKTAFLALASFFGSRPVSSPRSLSVMSSKNQPSQIAWATSSPSNTAITFFRTSSRKIVSSGCASLL